MASAINPAVAHAVAALATWLERTGEVILAASQTEVEECVHEANPGLCAYCAVIGWNDRQSELAHVIGSLRGAAVASDQ